MRTLFLVFMVTAAVPTAWTSECFSIQDADQRNACLGAVKADRSHCFKIQNKDLRNDCLANTPW